LSETREIYIVGGESLNPEKIPVPVPPLTSVPIEPAVYWRGRGQVEGLLWAAQLIDAETRACTDPDCEDCPGLRGQADVLRSRAKRMAKEWDVHRPEGVAAQAED
jgi:hypothetical protein